MKKYLIGVFFLIGILITLPASAATVKTGEEINIGKNEQITDNLYIGAGLINVGGIIAGDLIAAGGNIVVSGPVSQDRCGLNRG